MKKLLCVLCALALAVGLTPSVGAAGETTLAARGWFETICAQLPGVSDADVTEVSYTDADGKTLKLAGEDFTYLVRDMDGGVRIDIPGVKAGTYSLQVTAGGQAYTASGVEVLAYDRSGFAHWNYTEGVGAYHDDGTLKDNAVVLYVTEENKETVTLSARKGSQTITVAGIGNILNRYKDSVGNNDVLRYLATENKSPLVVRIVGRVTAPSGLTPWTDSTDFPRDNGNNGAMAVMKDTANVTVEGVGSDACMDGWGVAFTAGKVGLDNGLGKNFEVRNLTFRNVPEDGVEIDGRGSERRDVIVEHTWIHNCAFYVPYIENAAADDKHYGDSAVDAMGAQYMTMSYNYIEGYRKTCLVGGDDEDRQYHVTWHHNHWKDCNQRCPLARAANMHIYNNLYEGQTSCCMSLRANSYIFSEYNHFVGCVNPVRLEANTTADGQVIPAGVCKSWQDVFDQCRGVNQAVRVATKDETVPNTNTYFDFDTDPEISYIPAGDYALDESIQEARANIDAYAGPMKALEDIVTPGHRHSWDGGWQVLEAADCTHAGRWTRTCSEPDCPEGTQTRSVPACGHSYDGYVCTRCGDDLAGKTYELTGDGLVRAQADRPTPGMTLGGDERYPDCYYAAKAVNDVGGTEDFFTILYTVGTRLEPNVKSFGDGYKAANRLNFTYSASPKANAVQFILPGPATVRVWWIGAVSAADLATQAPRPMVILDEKGGVVATSETVGNTTTPMISTFPMNDPGIYCLGGQGGKNYLYKVEVTIAGPDVRRLGVLAGQDGRELGWRYTQDGQLTLTDPPGQGEAVWVGCYDGQGRLLAVKALTASNLSVPLGADVPAVKLFWLDAQARPLSEAATVWSETGSGT